jgi:[histone H3]-lysine36 N-dimethyltransferase SETMAR
VEKRNGQLASVLWDAIIFIDYLENGQTINNEYYMVLLERLNDEIKKKTVPHLKKKSAVSSRQCTVSQINQKDGKIVYELGYELVPHPPYSPDLDPSDFFLFADLKRMLVGKKFSTNDEVTSKLRPISRLS